MTKQWLKLCHNIKRNALIPFWQNNKSKIKSGNRSGHTQSKIDSSHRKWCRIYSIKYVIICIRFEAHLLFVDVMGFVIVVLLFLYNVHGLCSTNKHTQIKKWTSHKKTKWICFNQMNRKRTDTHTRCVLFSLCDCNNNNAKILSHKNNFFRFYFVFGAQVLDYTQYYLDLGQANTQGEAVWQPEYNLTTHYFGSAEVTAVALHNLADRFSNTDNPHFAK